MELSAGDPFTLGQPIRKRLRSSHACDSCRSRKIRCSGAIPCATCVASEIECTYGSEASSRGKSDLILEGILRVEKSIQDLHSSLAMDKSSSVPTASRQQHLSPVLSFSRSLHGSPPSDTATLSDSHLVQTPSSESQQIRGLGNTFDNAVLDSMHTSTTESILQWHHFDKFPSLRTNYVSVFHLEQSRPAFPTRRSIMYPYTTVEDLDSILDSFSNHVNFWYPTMSQLQIHKIRATLEFGAPDEESVEACLALLTMALGCASQVTAGFGATTCPTEDDIQRRLRKRKIGDTYFEGALKKIHLAHLRVSAEATQCLFFVVLYFAFLARPLQAWEFLSATAAKCLLLLAYPRDAETSEERERIGRIFWSCYILESDYMAELSACPPSGIARVESSVQLPGNYHTHSIETQEEQSSLYFLACISMRRLLNRVHQLLYARDSGAALDTRRFHRVVAELKHQLDEWRDVLPAAFAFSVDTAPTTTEFGGFLRQRYLTCKAVIYRPYLMRMLREGGQGEGQPSPDALRNCKACLDACMMHALNLRGFAHTVLVDTWICSLSMSGAMLILLSACQVATLRHLVSPDVLKLAKHLHRLFGSWCRLSPGSSSPSVDQSVWMISEADQYIQKLHFPPLF